MLYAAYQKWNDTGEPWLELVLSGTAFFMYFFRNRFDKKFADRNNQNTRGGAEQSKTNQNNQTNP